MTLTGDSFSTDLAEIIAAIPDVRDESALWFTFFVRPPSIDGVKTEGRIYVANIHRADDGKGFRILVKERQYERVAVDDEGALEAWLKDRAAQSESYHAVIREGNRDEAREIWARTSSRTSSPTATKR